MGNGDRLPADDAPWVRNVVEAAKVHGAVFQVGKVEGDVTLHTARDPLEVHDVPVVITIVQSEDNRDVVQFAGQRPAQVEAASWPGPGLWYRWTDGVTVLVEGLSARVVVLQALRPVVLARRPPPRIAAIDGTLSGLEPRRFIVDLDRDPPRLAAHGSDFPFAVSASDPEQFRIRLRVWDHEVDWRLELDWICAGRTGTVRIPETGHFTHYPIRSRLDESRYMAREVVTLLHQPDDGPKYLIVPVPPYRRDRPVRVGQVRVDPRADYRSPVVALRATLAGLGEVDVPIVPGMLRLHAYPAGDALEPAQEPLVNIELDESVYNDDDGWGPVRAIAQAMTPRLR